MTSMFSGEGYYSYRGPDGQKEDDFFVCKHCELGMLKSAWKSAGGFCMNCEGKICTNCHSKISKFGCQVVERKLDQALNDAYRRDQNRKILGL